MDLIVDGFYPIDPSRLLVFSRIVGVQPVGVGKNEQQLRFDQGGDERGQRIVVPELQFIYRDGIVFVNNWNGSVSQQLFNGV